MLIRATREFIDDVGRVRTGQILDMTDFRGMDLIRRGLATNVQGEAAESGAKGPTSSLPIASPIGPDKQPLSSQADQPPPQPASSHAEPNSSASTKDIGSLRSETSFTPATELGGRRGRASRHSVG